MSEISNQAGDFSRYIRIDNQGTIDDWTKVSIASKAFKAKGLSVLDIGAGTCRYKSFIESLELKYYSHDLNAYTPNPNMIGFQDEEWPKFSHDFVCDILEIPTDQTFDVLICTEVLEHVPDPVSALKTLTRLTKDDGEIIITVPLMSLIHQSPYYFQSGLSPYWFEFWSKKLKLEILELCISGDFLDTFNQFVRMIESDLSSNGHLSEITSIGNLTRDSIFSLSEKLSKSLLTSGGFGVFCRLKK